MTVVSPPFVMGMERTVLVMGMSVSDDAHMPTDNTNIERRVS